MQVSVKSRRTSHVERTPDPYGDCPFSSLLCRTLWKSYLFSCRTKLAKLLCLKCFGSMDLVNFSFCPSCEYGRRHGEIARTSRTTKLSPSSPQRTTCEYVGSSNILLITVSLRLPRNKELQPVGVVVVKAHL